MDVHLTRGSSTIPLITQLSLIQNPKSSKDLLCLYLNNNENSQLFTGKSLRLGGSKELYKDNGTFFGDLSAILIDNMPLWAEFSSTPSSKVSLMSEWETKLEAIIEESVHSVIMIGCECTHSYRLSLQFDFSFAMEESMLC